MNRRRSLLGTLAAAAVMPAMAHVAPVTPVLNVPSPDAELIRLASEHERLGRLSNVDFPKVDDDHPLAVAAEARRNCVSEQQAELLDRMVDLPPSTLEGVQAIAAALVVEDLELLRPHHWHDAGDHLVTLLVRSLLDMRGAA